MNQPTSSTGMLMKKVLVGGTIKTKTGLHIGGTNVGLQIGGTDATVVRNPLTNQPYIPGSSLKGKMRSLLEKLSGSFGPKLGKDIEHGPYTWIREGESEDASLIRMIFGTMPEKLKEKKRSEPSSRLIVRDSPLNRESAVKLLASKNTNMPFTEVKTEVVIDRVTSAATPRQLERVPAGALFDMQIILNVFSGDEEAKMVKKVLEALCLLNNDYLGGKGTRGSGEVEIKLDKEGLKYKDKAGYESDNPQWQPYRSETVRIPPELLPLLPAEKSS